MKKPKFYVVWKGQNPGIYTSWDQCKEQIQGFEGAVYKSFTDKELAEKAYHEGPANYLGKDIRLLQFSDDQKQLVGTPDPESISVDAACSGNPGILEYRGVYTRSGKEIFRKGPFQQGTVNIGEFLALVHGLALLKQKNSSIPVYSDSRTAISWVKNKKVKTTLERSATNEQLFNLIDRAIAWLNNNHYPNKVIK